MASRRRCGAQGLSSSAATKGAHVLGTLCFPISALSAKGQYISQKARVLCCRGLSSCSRVLRFASCLQMQQKFKVMICFDLLIFIFCFGLEALWSSLPTPLLLPLLTALHAVPLPGTLQLGFDHNHL